MRWAEAGPMAAWGFDPGSEAGAMAGLRAAAGRAVTSGVTGSPQRGF